MSTILVHTVGGEGQKEGGGIKITYEKCRRQLSQSSKSGKVSDVTASIMRSLVLNTANSEAYRY